uniref:uncharacterized protein LOC120333717 n=1 Tax=Styela clava TaxID=7725 RepID=UPI0019393A95|nr:uncharacterized protein LOC120333717 [Styela clava]
MAQGGGDPIDPNMVVLVENLTFVNNVNVIEVDQFIQGEAVQIQRSTSIIANNIDQVVITPQNDDPLPNPVDGAQDAAQMQADSAMPDDLTDPLEATKKLIDKLNPVESSEINQQLFLTECHFRGNDYEKAMGSLTSMQKLLTSSGHIETDNVIKKSESFIDEENNYVVALILISCASKMYKAYPDPNEAIIKIKQCLKNFCFAMRDLANSDPIILLRDLGLRMLQDIFDDLQSISGVDLNKKAEIVASCLGIMGFFYFHTVKRPLQSIELFERGISIMKQQFGQTASKFKLVGYLQHNIATTYDREGNKKKAKEYRSSAITSKKTAQDWDNESQKKKSLNKTKNYPWK